MKAFLKKYIYPLARLERFVYPLALFIGAFALFHWYWTTTPSYAITQTIDAIRKHDVDTLEKFVDIDQVTSHAFDDLLDSPGRNELMGHMDSFVGVGFIRFFKHEIVGIVHQRFCNAVADPGLNLDSLADGTAETLQHYRISPRVKQAMFDYGLNKYGFKGVKYLDVKGNYALLGLDFFSPKLHDNYTVEFRLEDVGGYWRFTQLTNLNELLTRYLQTSRSTEEKPAVVD